MTDLTHLVLAYSVVWLIVGAYLAILIMRNRRLLKQVEELEQRIGKLEHSENHSGE